MMTTVLINASPLIFLSKINKLDILPQLFKIIITTEQVKKEVLSNTKQINFDLLKNFLEEKVAIDKIEDESFLNNLLNISSLHIGEASLITLAKDKYTNKEILILDDKIARKIANIYNFKVLGTLGTLLLAAKKSVLKKEECKNSIDKLITIFDFRISTEVYIQIIRELDSYRPS